MMLEIHLYDPESDAWHSVDFTHIKLPLHGDQKIWLDLTHADAAQQQAVLHAFHIHPVIREDFLRQRHPPKLEASNDFTLLIMRAFAADDFQSYPGHAQLNLLFSSNVLIYKCNIPSAMQKSQFPRFSVEAPQSPVRDWVKHYIHAVSSSYLEKLIRFEEVLGELEDDMLSRGNDQKLAQAMRYRSVLRKIDRNLAYQKEMFDDIWLNDDHSLRQLQLQTVELRDFYEKFERLHSMTQMYYDQLGDLVNSYMSTTSYQISERMKLLTMVSSVFIPLTFIVGVYGMNFEVMPELQHPYGYFYTLGFMLLLALVMMLGFKLKRWW
jgi:magnesium transporter